MRALSHHRIAGVDDGCKSQAVRGQARGCPRPIRHNWGS
jgi:hypothetical protein